jgi:hypothetical protein
MKHDSSTTHYRSIMSNGIDAIIVGQTISIDLTQAWTNATVQNYAKET